MVVVVRPMTVAEISDAVTPSSRENLYIRLATYVKSGHLKRIKRGMIAEFKRLHENGLSWKRMEELGLEYRYGARLFQGMLDKDEFVAQLVREIRRYAKRQMTWFKRNLRINWLDIDDPARTESDASVFVREFIDDGSVLT
jgi:tRNA A37 N6-isopentenylltransferase MiaA